MIKLLPFILCLLPFSLFAQQQVILNSGDTVEVSKATLEGGYYALEKQDGRTSKLPKDLVKAVLGQDGKAGNQPIEYEQVFQVDDAITKDELFSRARSWFVDYYKNASKVLQVEDKESGELIGAAVYSHSYVVGGVPIEMKIDYRVSVKIKEGRYKVRIYNLYSSSAVQGRAVGNQIFRDGFGEITNEYKKNSNYLNTKRYNEMLISIKAYVRVLNESLFSAMNMATEKDEDW